MGLIAKTKIRSLPLASFACLALSLTFTACGKAPFLNHTEEESRTATSANASENQDDACRIRWNNYCGRLRWIMGPHEGLNVFQIDFVGENGQAANLSGVEHRFSLEAIMPSMGHGTSPVRLEWKSPSRVEVQELYFIMPGEWELVMILFETTARFRVRI